MVELTDDVLHSTDIAKGDVETLARKIELINEETETKVGVIPPNHRHPYIWIVQVPALNLLKQPIKVLPPNPLVGSWKYKTILGVTSLNNLRPSLPIPCIRPLRQGGSFLLIYHSWQSAKGACLPGHGRNQCLRGGWAREASKSFSVI